MRRISAPSTMKRVGSHHRFWILPPLGLKPLCLGFFFLPGKKMDGFFGHETRGFLEFFFWKDFLQMYDISTPHTLFIRIYPTFSKMDQKPPPRDWLRANPCPNLRGLLERQVLHHRFLVCPGSHKGHTCW